MASNRTRNHAADPAGRRSPKGAPSLPRIVRAAVAVPLAYAFACASAPFASRIHAQEATESSAAGAGGARISAAIARDVFFLVDVSGSIPFTRNASQRPAIQEMIADGKRLALRLVDGSFAAEDFPGWSWNEELLASPLREMVAADEEGQRLSGPGKRAVVLPFGDKARDHSIPVSPPFATFPADLEAFVEGNWPSAFRDQHTYLELARARTADLAESLQIRQYYMVMVTDDLSEPAPQATYTAEEQRLLHRWDSENFVASKTRIGLFKYVGSGLESKNFEVDVWRVDLDLAPAPARILTLTPPSGGTLRPGSVDVSWAVASGSSGARSQPQGYTYYLSLLDAESGAMLQSLALRDQYAATLPVGTPGNYRLVLSGTRHDSAGEPGLPDNLGQGEALFSVADPPARLGLVLVMDPLRAGRESAISWRREAPEGAPAISGEFHVTVVRLADGSVVLDQRTREPSLSTVFPAPGDYRLRIDFHPDGGGVMPGQIDEVVRVGEDVDYRLQAEIDTPLRAGRESSVAWRLVAPEDAPALSGEFRVAIEKEDGSGLLDQRTREFSLSTKFPAPGTYRLRIEFHPDRGGASVDPIELSLPVEEEEQLALRFLIPAANAKVTSKKVTFKWLAPDTDPKPARYRLQVSGPESFNEVVPISNYAKTFKKQGRYTARVSVVAPEELVATVESAQVVFTIDSGSGAFWWIVLLLLLGLAVGYYIRRRSQDQKRKAAVKASKRSV